MKTFRITAIVLLLALCLSPSYGAESLESWGDMLGEIKRTLSTNSVETACAQSKTFQLLVANKNPRVFMELVVQEEPLLRMAGYFGIIKVAPKQAFATGARIIMSENSTFVNFELAPSMERLGLSELNPEMLNGVFYESPIRVDALNRILDAVPMKCLADWFDHADKNMLSPSIEALVLARLLSGNDIPHFSKSKMEQALNDLKDVPGIPRLTYLRYGDETHAGYFKTMEAVLEDELFPKAELFQLVRYKKDYIRKHIQIEDLKLTGERQAQLSRYLMGN